MEKSKTRNTEIMKTENKKPQNPSAFPLALNNDRTDFEQGMTLRDYFANSAMQGLLSNENEIQRAVKKSTDVNSVIASISYALADAMLKVRQKTELQH